MSTLYVNTITPNSGDTVSVSGSLFVSGTINLGDANTDSVAFGADISSSIIPDASSTYNLGSLSKTWDELHVDAVATKLIISPSGLTITASSNIVPVNGTQLTLGNTLRPWNVLHVNSITASNNITASGITTNTVTTNALTASAISCSGTVIADSFQSMGGDDTLQFNDSLSISGSVFAAQGVSASSGVFSTDVTVGDDLSLISDSAVFNMGVDNDFTITHDGSTGALISATPISVHSIGSTLTLSGSAAIISAHTGDVSISAGDDIVLSAADDISLTSTSEDGLITLHSAHTAGQSILIDANANAGSILDVDAGILDIDVQAAATLDAVGIALNAGSGELDLTTTGTLDVNANALDMDLTDSSDITLTSSEAAEDLTISQVGANDSSIIITAAGTGTDAIKLDATAGSMLIAPSLADGKTLRIGKNGATEMIFAPHGTATSEKIEITNVAGTEDDALKLSAGLGAITLESLQTIITSNHPKLTIKSDIADGDGSLIFKSGDGSTMATIRCDVTNNVMNQLSIGSGTNETHLVLDANGKIGIGVQTPGEQLTVTGNVSASGAVYASGILDTNVVEQSGTAAEDLTAVAKNTVWYANTAQAGAITLPQATATNVGMVIKIIVGTTDWSTTAFKLGFANGGSTVLTGYIRLGSNAGSEAVDGFVVTANAKSLEIDADDPTAAGGAIGSTYTFTYLEANLVHVEANGQVTTGTPALDAGASTTAGI